MALRYNTDITMKVTAYKTPIVTKKDDLFTVIKNAIPAIPERSILVISSKLVSTCEGRFVEKKSDDRSEKHELVRQEAEYYTEPHSSKYDLMLTIKHGQIFVNAGIDESNANEQYLLWPEDPQRSANKIWEFLRSEFAVQEVGITLSDSSTFPLYWGVIGRAIAHCGFNPLYSYVGREDLFGRKLKMEKSNVAQAVTAAAVLEMGEGSEQTPLALVENIRQAEFFDHPPTDEELAELKIALEDDVYAPILTKAEWKKGDDNV